MTESFKTIRERFEKWFEKEYERPIKTSAIENENKIPDFVLLNPGKQLQVVEIKKRGHVFSDVEYERLHRYIEALDKFLADHEEFQSDFGSQCNITLVCDQVKLNQIYKDSFEKLEDEKRLQRIPWNVFLVRTENAHLDFITAIKPKGTNQEQEL